MENIIKNIVIAEKKKEKEFVQEYLYLELEPIEFDEKIKIEDDEETYCIISIF